jgi:ParB family chromosome partitioning protein
MSKNPDPQRKALGKGLSALLPSKQSAPSIKIYPPGTNPNHPNAAAPAPAPEPPHAGMLKVPIDKVVPNPLQPRTIFEPDRLQELAQSIRANGIIQPLVVQRRGSDYELVAGERRLRAAKIAGLAEVPVVVQEVATDHLLEVALIENIQREDLNPIEVAHALDRLAREYNLSHEEIGRRTGKDRATVSNLIRLLKLPSDIQLLVAEHRLSMGHARALLAIEDTDKQREIAERAAAHGMSVRQLERTIQSLVKRDIEEALAPVNDPNVTAATRELESALGTRVKIVAQTEKRGRIEIEYYSPEDLDRIYNVIIGSR